MRNRPFVLMLVVACCLAFSPEAKGSDVYSWSGVSYEPELGSMRAFVQIYASYDTQLYYCVSMGGYVYENEIEIGRIYAVDESGNGYTACGGWALAEQYYPYDPNAEYTMEAIPELNVTLRGSNEYYYDYYSYIEYTYGEPVYYPNSYSFIGRGPENPVNLQNIVLGTLTSGFSSGGASGAPHHLKVITDRTITRTDICGQAEKRIDFQLVDINNRATGRVSLSEEPQSNLMDSCSGMQVFLNSCSAGGVNLNGTFTDAVKTGCPLNGGTPTDNTCGYGWGNRWRWCDTKVPNFTINLAWMYYDVRRAYVKVDGQLDMTDEAYKYP